MGKRRKGSALASVCPSVQALVVQAKAEGRPWVDVEDFPKGDEERARRAAEKVAKDLADTGMTYTTRVVLRTITDVPL